MSLRDAIQEVHSKAEKHPLVQQMLSGELSESAYAAVLACVLPIYAAVEANAKKSGLLEGLEGICRAPAIQADLDELGGGYPNSEALSHALYCGVLPKESTLAHLYVYHMGDMHGGQLMKSKLPGSCTRYDFEGRSDLIAQLRTKLTDDLADEAIRAFEMLLGVYDAVAAEHDILRA